MPFEIKVLCQCGQKYKFDVEPVEGQIPFPVRCPVCATDGSAMAHAILAEKMAATPLGAPAFPTVPPPTRGLRVAQPAAPPVESVPAPPIPRPAAVPSRAARAAAQPEDGSSGWPQFNMMLGFLGALVGAGVGFGFLLVFALLTGIRFPLMGLLIGFLTGLMARLFFRGTDNTLGIIAAVVALGGVVGSQLLIFGGISIFNIISMIVSVSFAYKQASE